MKVIAGAALAVVTGLLIANHFIPGGFQFATYRKLGSENAVSMDLTVEERIELMKRIQRLAPDEVESKWGDKHLARGTRQGGPPNDCGWQSWVS
ncbi:MAG: hypothetical protein LBJ62_11120 [Bifidobacteriaceae bacterium]|nr:hypothetical protein [Bifidobacteriaceae bacterium]